MSWMKRRGQTTSPSNLSATQMYGGNQHFNQESSQWNPQDHTSNNWLNQPPPQNEPKQQPYQYNPTQTQANYWQQQQYATTNYNPNQSNQYQQQQLYSQQNYYPTASATPQSLNDQYNQPTQHYNYIKTEVQNNPYSIQQQQQQQSQPQQSLPSEQDSWGNWGWGDEDNSNIHPPQNVNSTIPSDSIVDSFNAEESWNWSVDESSSSTSTLNFLKPEHSNATTSLTSLDSFNQDAVKDGLFPKMGKLADKHNNVLDNSEAQANKNIPQEPAKVPSVMKLRNSENLTPQWSMESQMSQESSDDILQTSESDKMLSRSSTISQSPISGQDGLGENLMPVQEVSNSKFTLLDIKQEPIAELDGDQMPYAQPPPSQQYENIEIISNIKQEPLQHFLPPQANPTTSHKSHTPSPPVHNLTPPPLAQVATNTPPPPMKNQTPPLMSSHGVLDDSINPYKRNTSQIRVLNSSMTDRPPPPGFQPFTQSVNLETLPDNSEQPDSLLPLPTNQGLKKNNATGINSGTQQVASQQFPDNNEVAPINERNQYLETGQLSDESTNQLQVENNDTFPPPGLRRMVLGQMESSDTSQNATVDEPPPGLSRMVLGQTESSSSLTNALNPRDSNGPPVGFSRMVPGESSSPETNSRHQYQVYQDDTRHEEYNSEVEMNQLHSSQLPQTRSATIGADTPPTVANPVITQSNMNRSETIGSDSKADDSRSLGSISENRVGVGVDRGQRDNLIGATNQDGEKRRDSIEGELHHRNLKDILSGVRDMSLSAEVGVSTNELEQNSRGRSRQESSDSDREADGNKSPRDHRDRKYREKEDKRDKNRSRYSPDNYRDKRYDRRRPKDRRFEDESDYYSDKEKDARREEKKEDYDKRYGTLRSKDKERRKRDGWDRRDPREEREGRDVRDNREYDRRERDHHRDYDRRDVRNRGDYYYYDEGYDGQRSRPSSRTDSMHDSYRDRHDRDHRRQRERPRDRNRDVRRHRDFDPYMQGFNYDPYNPYYQQYQYYYENLRRTNPQAYLEWYRKYYQQAGIASSAANFSNEDRGSVHSGRSSANEDIKERYMRQNYYSHSSLPHVGGYYRDTQSVSGQYGMDESSYGRPFDTTESVLLDDSTAQAQRLTPAKFATAHVKASISSGKLVKILPNYPLDGQNAVVELLTVQNLLSNDDEIEELSSFPGPLVRGTTHKKTVIEYCESKIRNAGYNENIIDSTSYILLWELMILLIRQNGMVVGTDIAELLMKDRPQDLRPPSTASNASSAIIDAHTPSEASNIQSSETISVLKEDVVTNKFREYLIYGSEKEALEWAMKHGLWGHALFLASKLDKRTYANVMMRFANGLTMNDPLQTLYQLLSGRIPAAVTSVADEKWGDWRPHLAMILSNTTSKPELDRKAITTLADTLMTRGSIYAAQFCYLMAEVGFSRYSGENAKLVLLGSNHHKPFLQFATNEAIHLTEIYEYACSLNDAGFLILEFQPYKYLLATRLSDRGLLEKALAYLEKVSQVIIQNPTAIQPSLIDRVCYLADRLKYYDPVEEAEENEPIEGGGDLDISRPDNSWLKDLKNVQSDYNMGLISHESVNNLMDGGNDYEASQTQQIGYENQSQMGQDMWQNQQQQFQQQQQQSEQYQQGGYAQWQTPHQVDQEVRADQLQQSEVQEGYHQEPQQQPYWPQQAQQQWGGNLQQQQLVINYGGGQIGQEGQVEQQDVASHQQTNDYWNSAQNEPEGVVEKSPKEDVVQPQITMPNQVRRQDSIDSDETSTPTEKTPKPSPAKSKPAQKGDKPAARTGWFGGIFSTFGLRPKNQMKLPDDKNPSIVWDEKRKKWVNLDEDGSETSSEFKPPPKMADFIPKMQADPVGQPGIEQQQQQPFVAYHQHANNPINAPNPIIYGQTQDAPHIITAPTIGAPGNTPSIATGDEAPKPAQTNMFKLQRGRNLKKSYVDVFNPTGKSFDNVQTMVQNPVFPGATASGGGQVNYFVPAVVNDPNAPVDFLTPASLNTDNNQAIYQQPQ